MVGKLVTLAVPHSNSSKGDGHSTDKLMKSNCFLIKSECFGIVLYFSDKHNSDLLFLKISYAENKSKNKNPFYLVVVVVPL